MEPSTLKGSLGSEVALVGVGDDSGKSMIGRDVQQGGQCLCCVAVATGRRGQTVADLDASVVRLALEADASDGLSVGGSGDPVGPEGALVSVGGRGSQESRDADDVAVERKVLSPGVLGRGTSRHDAFALGGVDCMQGKPSRLEIGHGTSQAALAGRRQPNFVRGLHLVHNSSISNKIT